MITKNKHLCCQGYISKVYSLTCPFNSRGGVAGPCAAELRPLTLMNRQHRWIDRRHRLDPLSSYSDVKTH